MKLPSEYYADGAQDEQSKFAHYNPDLTAADAQLRRFMRVVVAAQSLVDNKSGVSRIGLDCAVGLLSPADIEDARRIAKEA